MRRLKQLLQHLGLQFQLVGLFAVLFSWPFLAPDLLSGLENALVYLILVWAAAIFLLFGLSRAQSMPAPRRSSMDHRED